MVKKQLLLFICIFLIVFTGCFRIQQEIYKVNYKGNNPLGLIKATIGNEAIFTNGPDILEVYKKPLKFFCYEIGEEYFCRESIQIKISEDASQRIKNITINLEILKADEYSNRTILSKKLIYYFDNKKLEELEIDAKLKGELINQIAMPVLGIGKTKNEARKDGMKKVDELFNILMDVKQ